MRNDDRVMSQRIKCPAAAAAAPCRLFVTPNVMTNMGGHFWLKRLRPKMKTSVAESIYPFQRQRWSCFFFCLLADL